MKKTPIRVRDGLRIIEATLRQQFPGATITVGKSKIDGRRVWWGNAVTAEGEPIGQIDVQPDTLHLAGQKLEEVVFVAGRALRARYVLGQVSPRPTRSAE